MRLNAAGFEMIKRHEGLRLQAYQDAVGVWTIGYGNTFYPGGKAVQQGDVITHAEAVRLLVDIIEYFEKQLDPLLKYDDGSWMVFGANQYAAIISFVYNVGVGNFSKSTLLKKLKRGDYAGAANEFPRWNKAGGRVLAGLTKRREEERQLFLR